MQKMSDGIVIVAVSSTVRSRVVVARTPFSLVVYGARDLLVYQIVTINDDDDFV